MVNWYWSVKRIPRMVARSIAGIVRLLSLRCGDLFVLLYNPDTTFRELRRIMNFA
jgi:hypothetical protein